MRKLFACAVVCALMMMLLPSVLHAQQMRRDPGPVKSSGTYETGGTHHGPPEHKYYLPNEAQNSPEARAVLAAGAQRLDLPGFQTFAVYWFPDNYAKLPDHRVLFVMHGSFGNAYQGIYHHIDAAKAHGYGLISLQWWRGGGEYTEPRPIESAFFNALMTLSKQYPINPKQLALETFSRSGAISYEIAYWNKQMNHPNYKLVIVQSGGIPAEAPRPLVSDMLDGKLGKMPLADAKFFMYCGGKDREWGPKMCIYMHNAQAVVEKLGGQVVQFIDDPNGGHGGLDNTPAYSQAAVQQFLNLTAAR